MPFPVTFLFFCINPSSPLSFPCSSHTKKAQIFDPFIVPQDQYVQNRSLVSFYQLTNDICEALLNASNHRLRGSKGRAAMVYRWTSC